ncbi:MAG: IS630 transposase-related protein, partial [Spirulinaceae cyanobacterium]
MPYSLDLRKKVIKYIEDGGKITSATKVFNLGRATIYRWLNRQNLEATKVE